MQAMREHLGGSELLLSRRSSDKINKLCAYASVVHVFEFVVDDSVVMFTTWIGTLSQHQCKRKRLASEFQASALVFFFLIGLFVPWIEPTSEIKEHLAGYFWFGRNIWNADMCEHLVINQNCLSLF